MLLSSAVWFPESETVRKWRVHFVVSRLLKHEQCHEVRLCSRREWSCCSSLGEWTLTLCFGFRREKKWNLCDASQFRSSALMFLFYGSDTFNYPCQHIVLWISCSPRTLWTVSVCFILLMNEKGWPHLFRWSFPSQMFTRFCPSHVNWCNRIHTDKLLVDANA